MAQAYTSFRIYDIAEVTPTRCWWHARIYKVSRLTRKNNTPLRTIQTYAFQAKRGITKEQSIQICQQWRKRHTNIDHNNKTIQNIACLTNLFKNETDNYISLISKKCTMIVEFLSFVEGILYIEKYLFGIY